MKKQTQTEHKLDALLSNCSVSAPTDFSDQVVEQIAQQNKRNMSTETALSTSNNTATPLWQWLALGTASVAGASQMIGFVFGIWTATTAG